MTDNGFKIDVKEKESKLVKKVTIEISGTGFNLKPGTSVPCFEAEEWIKEILEKRLDSLIEKQYKSTLISIDNVGQLKFFGYDQSDNKINAAIDYQISVKP